MKKKSLNDMCRHWQNMCQINRRYDALKSVSEFFCLADHTAKLQALFDKNKNVCMSRFDVFIDFLAAEKSILADIRAQYGESIYNSVYNSLK